MNNTFNNKRKYFKPSHIVYYIYDDDCDREGRILTRSYVYTTSFKTVLKYFHKWNTYTYPLIKYCLSKDKRKIYRLDSYTDLRNISNENELEWRINDDMITKSERLKITSALNKDLKSL